MSVTIQPRLQTAPSAVLVGAGRPVRSQTVSALARHANSYLAARFLSHAHVQVERDLTISTGSTAISPNPQPDVLYDSTDADAVGVWMRCSAVGTLLWVGFRHASVELSSVKDGAGTSAPEVRISLYSSGGVLRGATTIPGRRLHKLSNYQRGITAYRDEGEQLALNGNVGYASTEWGSDELLDISADQGGRVYIEVEAPGVRLYSLDLVEAYLGVI